MTLKARSFPVQLTNDQRKHLWRWSKRMASAWMRHKITRDWHGSAQVIYRVLIRHPDDYLDRV